MAPPGRRVLRGVSLCCVWESGGQRGKHDSEETHHITRQAQEGLEGPGLPGQGRGMPAAPARAQAGNHRWLPLPPLLPKLTFVTLISS
jgi:hypothetical protein